jgi:O-antigen/teichoic acid export membrane protein
VTGRLGHRVLANLWWLLGGKGASALLGLAYLALAARSLGPVSFGDFAVAVAGAQLLVALVSFQSWQIIGRYGPGLRERATGLAELLGVAAALDALSALAGSALGLLAVVLAGWHFGWGDDMRIAASLLVLGSMLALRATPIGMLRLDGRFGAAAAAESVVPLVRTLGAGAAAWLTTGPSGFLLAWAAAELASALACWWLALRDAACRPRWRGWSIARSLPGFWRFASTTHALGSLNAGSKQLTVIAVAAVLDPAAAGLYRIAAQFAQAVAKTGQLVSRAALSEFAALAARGLGALDAEVRALSLRLAIGSALALAAAGAAGPPALQALLGAAFPSLAGPFLLFAAAGALKVVAAPLEPALLAVGAERHVLSIAAAAVAGELVLAALLASAFGLTGAAAGTLAAATATALMLVTVWQLRVRTNSSALARRIGVDRAPARS